MLRAGSEREPRSVDVTTTKTIESVAQLPEPGDTVVLSSGMVEYRVLEVTISPTKAEYRSKMMVAATRTETLREEPFMRSQQVVMDGLVWRDLVTRCAVTVR